MKPLARKAPLRAVPDAEETSAATPPREVFPFPADIFRAVVGMVIKAAPSKGENARVIFDVEPDGRPIVAAHDENRCHVGYLPLHADCAFRGAVERASVRKLYRLLGSVEEIEESQVHVDKDGRVHIERPGQPPLRHNLVLLASILTDWRPPPDVGATDLPFALPVLTAHMRDASRMKDAVVTTSSRSSARVIVNVSLAGEIVFRAVIAEAGMALYGDAAKQSKLPGVSR